MNLKIKAINKMGLLSFFKPNKRANLSAHAHQRSALRESAADSEQRLRQRARWRLLGACILVAISVALLPALLDITPQPVTSMADIKMRQPHTDTTASALIEVKPPSAGPSISRSSVNALSANPAETALSQGEEVVSQHRMPLGTRDTLAMTNNNEPGLQTNQTTTKFFLKAGVFASETRAYNWLAKLKAAKLPARVYHKKMAEGDRYLVRVGPFTDHESAQAAQKKLQNMGLPSIISEGTPL